MARVVPLGSMRYRGNSDVVLPRKFEGTILAGGAVSRVAVDASQPTVKAFDGTGFAGFAVHDLDDVRKVTGVVKKGEGVCLRVKEGETLTEGGGFAVDNVTSEVVASGAADSTEINGEVEEIGIIGLDENCNEIPDCVLVNLYGGTSTAVGGSSGIPEAPTDGKQYGRQNSGWTEIVAAAGEEPAAAPTPESAEAKTSNRSTAKK
ncbi:hypothetical protein [Vibrio parahaemolyticus]|uniref:hypothetical protein n=1 Tax=Vibrio parahaemolyticus TaxID=670 RepID=UPI00044BE6C8|nr:hypothetical protein [Vibrio parahaemolyticus]EHR0247429.1 hypothetical protein [Vibrio parahaemolyticus]EXJ31224.1 hypothetical protein D050_3546 [Vibrio parahaemolyticus VPCR-2009]